MHALLFLLLFSSTLYAESTVENDLSLIADHLRAKALSSRYTVDPDRVRDYIARQEGDGSWPDIDYDDTSRTHWTPSNHLRRLQTLARACRGGVLEGSVEVRDAFLSGLRFWVKRDPQSDNWWSNVIGSPRSLGGALLLMGKDVPPNLIAATEPLIRRSGFTRTGANLVWEASNLLTWACVTGDTDLLHEVVEQIGNEIRITTEEGIQHDDSFYQHGPQNYALGYGRSFAFDVTEIAVALKGTVFAFPKEKVRILSRLILDGQQWFVYGRQINYHTMGREAFRGRPRAHSWNAHSLAGICENMRSADPSRALEYDAFAARVTGKEPSGTSGPLGNKHFWRSDTMVHRARDWYASVRFHSTRTFAVETRVNRESLQGYLLSDGVIFLMQRGDEYHDLQPVWDYRKLPGLTFLETDAPLPYGNETPRAGNTSFVGGVSDGLNGVAVMDYAKGGVRAKKGYFFTDQGVVCLGADITCKQPERVLTTLNQCQLKSDIAVLRKGKVESLQGERLEASNIQAVLHDGVAYVLLEEAPLVIQAREQSGSWSLVEAKASDKPVPEDVFTCFIDHGAKPAATSYAYLLVPGASSEDLPALPASVRVLTNTPELQVVSSEALTQAIFHAPGTLGLLEGGRLSVDAACLVQLRIVGDTRILTVADPTQELRQLSVTIDGRWTGQGASYLPGDNATHIVVVLPEGSYAGQSIVIPLSRP